MFSVRLGNAGAITGVIVFYAACSKTFLLIVQCACTVFLEQQL